MTGYDLKTQIFDYTISHFWAADQAQIYRTLDKMAESGWVESQIEFQENRPNRKVYSLTEAGLAELNRWLTTYQAPPPYREPFLIQLFHGQDLSNATLLHMLHEQLKAHQERLATYEAIPLPTVDKLEGNREFTLQRLTLEMGISVEKAHIDWVKTAIETVKGLAE